MLGQVRDLILINSFQAEKQEDIEISWRRLEKRELTWQQTLL